MLLLLDLSITAQVRRRRRRRCWCHRCRRRRRNCPRHRRFAAVLLAATVFQLGLLPGRRRPVLRGSFFTVGQLVLEMIVFDRGAAVAAAHRAWNFAAAAATIVSKVKITVDDGCDGGRNTVAASTVTITTTTAATATIALRNKDAVGVAVTGAGRS